jgi:two-component system C4-dicarboxylate transport sensor histidine kinase DctB
MVNLLGNALQAVEDENTRKITIAARSLEEKVIVSVEDSGKGIESEHLPHIFEPFYTTKKSGHGLGLGLTITKRILQDMNGDIEVKNSDHGARFEFFLEKAETYEYK